MEDRTRSMVRSTAGLLNLRLASAARTTGKAESAAQTVVDPRARAEVTNEVSRIKSLRFIVAFCCCQRETATPATQAFSRDTLLDTSKVLTEENYFCNLHLITNVVIYVIR